MNIYDIMMKLAHHDHDIFHHNKTKAVKIKKAQLCGDYETAYNNLLELFNTVVPDNVEGYTTSSDGVAPTIYIRHHCRNTRYTGSKFIETAVNVGYNIFKYGFPTVPVKYFTRKNSWWGNKGASYHKDWDYSTFYVEDSYRHYIGKINEISQAEYDALGFEEYYTECYGYEHEALHTRYKINKYNQKIIYLKVPTETCLGILSDKIKCKYYKFSY